MGRWMSPDPSGLAFARLTNPQTFNLYAYALNNPLRYTDPTGLYCYYGDTGTGSSQWWADQNDPTQWDYHSSQSECETPDENGNVGQWTNDAETHYDAQSNDWVENDNRPEQYTLSISTPVPSWLQTSVQTSLTAVQQNGFYLQGIENFTTQNVLDWAATGPHIPNGPAHLIKNPLGALYWHGNWCGAGGSGAPTDSQDAACLAHDFLYAQYGYTAGSNLDGYNPGLQEINQGLCDTAGSALVTIFQLRRSSCES